jgi:hypothetical protein
LRGILNNKLIGVLLLIGSGLIVAIGEIGSQIAFAIVLSGFYAGKLTGDIPPGPENATLHWIVIVPVVVLALMGLFFLFRPGKSE